MTTRSPTFGLKRALARGVGGLSRISGRGGGTTLPGRLLLRTAPDALERLRPELAGGSAIVSATNGKTTTASMIAAALRDAGRDPVHNHAGSNMAWGVATAMLEQDGDEGLFEVDEAWLPAVSAALEPRLLVLLNLFRDQLDRYGELERLADEWRDVVAAAAGRGADLILNADDPLVADLGRDANLAARPNVTYFGIEDPASALGEIQHAHDAKHCRRCGAPYRYARTFAGHLGHYECPDCGAGRPAPAVAAEAIRLEGMTGSSFRARIPGGAIDVHLPLPGLYNVYNALAAIAAALRLGLGPEAIERSLAGAEAVFGRVETIAVGGRDLSILLIKNPVGATEVLRTLSQEAERSGGRISLWLGLNDRIADGRDVSWIWDADFELLADLVEQVTCAGTRAAEMAVRLKYAGWPAARISVREPIATALDEALAAGSGPLFALPTYTALLELRTLLSRRGLAEEFWR